ncbi:hypothetical protein PSZ81_23915, partial [Shigella sonnei]|nr:hypothetical protein [Shigella sonnei]
GFKFTVPLLTRFMIAVLYGDLFERVVYRTRPYEATEGSVNELHAKWLEKDGKNVESGSIFEFNRNMKKIDPDSTFFRAFSNHFSCNSLS